MKKFDDLIFEPHHIVKESKFLNSFDGGNTFSLGNENAKKSKMFFKNGYGVSVVFGKCFYSNGVDTYEIAVLVGNETLSDLSYDTPITDDVIGYITKDEVSEIMKKVQELPKKN